MPRFYITVAPNEPTVDPSATVPYCERKRTLFTSDRQKTESSGRQSISTNLLVSALPMLYVIMSSEYSNKIPERILREAIKKAVRCSNGKLSYFFLEMG